MARLWWDGFEYNSNAVLAYLYAGNLTVGVNPYTGIASLAFGAAGSSYAYLTLDAAKSEIYIKFHYRPGQNVVSTGAICGFYKGATCIGWLQTVNRDLKFFSGTGTGTQLGSTASNVLSANAADYNLIEVRLKMHDSAGYAQVRVNEALVIDSGACDTMPTADADMDRIYFGACGGANHTGQYQQVDDFIVDDAAWIGNRRVSKIQITGVGTTTEWDPSAGNVWDCIDEIPFSDADFTSTNVADEVFLCACSDLPVDATSAKGIMLIGRAAEEGTATPQNVQLAIRTNATNYFGDSYAPPSGSPGFFKKLWVVNPNTTVDFTVSEINAIELGGKAVA